MKKSRYSLLKDDWLDCTRCLLHEHRRHVVMCRGKLPCDVLFVGEAPGESEDVLGSPFEGPAGIELDGIIEEAFEDEIIERAQQGVPSLRVAFTNLVGCIPHNDEGNKYEVPKAALKACRPRLVELCKIARPKLVVQVGVLSEKHWNEKVWDAMVKTSPPRFVKIHHPAAILRAGDEMKPIMRDHCVVALSDAAESVFNQEG